MLGCKEGAGAARRLQRGFAKYEKLRKGLPLRGHAGEREADCSALPAPRDASKNALGKSSRRAAQPQPAPPSLPAPDARLCCVILCANHRGLPNVVSVHPVWQRRQPLLGKDGSWGPGTLPCQVCVGRGAGAGCACRRALATSWGSMYASAPLSSPPGCAGDRPSQQG